MESNLGLSLGRRREWTWLSISREKIPITVGLVSIQGRPKGVEGGPVGGGKDHHLTGGEYVLSLPPTLAAEVISTH